MSKQFSRRRFLVGMGAAGVATGSYMRFWEPSWLQVGRHEIAMGGGAAPIKLLQLSDFHASSVVSLEQIKQSIDLGLSLKPDVICLTGDFVTGKYDRFVKYADILKRLSDAAPTFACLGNHDGGSWVGPRGGYADSLAVRGLLGKSGVQLLRNVAADIEVKGRKLMLVGVGDLWSEELDAEKAFAGVASPANSTVVLLSHNPDSKSEVGRYPWQVMLCGHTHGGQLRVPLVGYPFAPVRDKRFVEGLHRWKGRWIHITRGVGNLHGMRLNCPPEVSLVTLG